MKAEALRRAERLLDLFGGKPGSCRVVSAEKHLLAQEKDSEKKSAHRENAKGEQEQDAGEFAEEVFEARDRLGQDGVDGAILEIRGSSCAVATIARSEVNMLIAPSETSFRTWNSC